MATKFLAIGNNGNYGNQVVYGKNDLKALLVVDIKMYGYLLNHSVDFHEIC
jgi:hypothetical protein